MSISRMKTKLRLSRLLTALPLVAVFVLAACGGGMSAPAGSANTSAPAAAKDHSLNASGGQADASTKPDAAKRQIRNAQQYLIKTLAVTMEIKDTTRVASDLLTWVTTTDPLATSAGTDYQQAGDNLYRITLTFSVSSKAYDQVYPYLRDYPSHHGGKLAAFQEQVQDVSDQYVDASSQLTNLKKEQGRIQTLMGQAQNLNDTITLEGKLTEIEGKIESIEAQLNSLKAQTTFYKVTVNLYPTEAPPPPPPPTSGWNFGQTLHDAFAASLAFAQVLVTFIVWLLAFSVYIIPVGLLIWGVIKVRSRFLGGTPPSAPSVK
jgi:hypothetical protein